MLGLASHALPVGRKSVVTVRASRAVGDMSTDLRIRPVSDADAGTCARIIYEAFKGIANKHNFPPDFPAADATLGLTHAMLGTSGIYGVVAESGGQVVGCNFLDLRDSIAGVGPITVDPAWQGRGAGRLLMRAVLDRGRGAAGIRLVQDVFNTTSLPLYASLGFEVREPLVLMRGAPRSRPSGDAEVRPLGHQDLEECAALCRSVHRFDRANELRRTVAMFRPFVLLRNGRVSAYASAPTFWHMNHGVAATEQDMRQLLLGASAS